MPTTPHPLLIASIVAAAITPLMPGAGPPPTKMPKVAVLTRPISSGGHRRPSGRYPDPCSRDSLLPRGAPKCADYRCDNVLVVCELAPTVTVLRFGFRACWTPPTRRGVVDPVTAFDRRGDRRSTVGLSSAAPRPHQRPAHPRATSRGRETAGHRSMR